MFLKSIHIKNYNQFENLELDLTYPKGHAKAGEPLEKICIIGDNGTGKTTILETLDYFYSNALIKPLYKEKSTITVEGTPNAKILCETVELDSSISLKNFKLLYFPTGPNLSTITSHSPRPNGKTPFIINPFRKRSVFITSNSDEISNENDSVFNLSDKETFKTWNLLKEKIKDSVIKELRYRDSFNRAIGDLNEATIDKIHADFKKYKSNNPNGYDEFAAFLNPILNTFHLELNPDINLRKFSEMDFFELKSKDGSIIPVEQWSTGIRHLIYTILPLYAIKPKRGVILIDEAENSLYPNTQRKIVNFYKSICPNMQLIFATHSPILASSFEPWEVIELKFNEQGKVERKPYFKGENHVDNYHIHPMYLRWDTLFEEMFGVEGEGNDARTKMRTKLSILDREMEKANGKAEKKRLFEKYSKVAELLDWKTLDDA